MSSGAGTVRPLRIIAIVLGAAVAWLGVVAGLVINWGSLAAAQMETKYEILARPDEPIVLMGSSSMQVWTQSDAALGPLTTVNLGIGGSVVESWYPLVDRLIAPFEPVGIVIYLGANDLHNDGQAPHEVFAELQALVAQLSAAAPEAKLYFVSVYTTAAHADMADQDRELNELARGMKDVTFIDVSSSLLGPDGAPQPGVFLEDGVHLNSAGYEIFGGQIRAALMKDFGGPATADDGAEETP